MTDYVVFDLETVPDLEVARRLLGLGPDVPDVAVREALGRKYARADQDPRDVFLKAPLHRIVCIGAVFANRDDNGAFTVRSLGARHVGEKSEVKLIGDFVSGMAHDASGKGPVLVSFNGGGFDLPVLRYRALAQSVAVPGLFHGYARDYWYRFGRDHLDLCDLLSGFGASGRPSLNEMAALLGVPAKLEGMDGSKVEAAVNAGALDDIAAYCLCDVVVTFRLMLRFALVRGEIDGAQMAASEASLDEGISRQLKNWPKLAAVRQIALENA